MNINTKYLKNMLRVEITRYNNEKNEMTVLLKKKEYFKEIFNIFAGSHTHITESKLYLEALFEGIYGDKNLFMLFINDVKTLKEENYEKDSPYYKRLMLKLNIVSDKLKADQLMISEQMPIKFEYIKNNKKCTFNYVQLLLKINNRQMIGPNEQQLINGLLLKNRASSKEKTGINEVIRIHNDIIMSKRNNVPYKYEGQILELLNFGFETVDLSALKYVPKLEEQVESQSRLWESYKKNINFYEEYLISYYKDESVLKSVVGHLTANFQMQIYNLNELIKDENFYADESIRNEISEDFTDLVTAYTKMHDLYDKLVLADDSLSEKTNYQHQIVFCKDDRDEPYVLKDIEDVPEEYLGKVSDLINNFCEGNITKKQIEGFKNNFTEFRKLKNDQIRIVIKQSTDNIWIVFGIILKKEQNGVLLYKKITSRKMPSNIEESLKETPEIKKKLIDYIENNRRKGNR